MSYKNKFLISALVVIAMSAVMLFAESNAGGESGIIVKLELAPSIQEVEQLVTKYDEEHIHWLRLNTKLDFLFILTYSGLFFFALKSLSGRMNKQNELRLVALAAFVPGVLDVVENIFILGFLNRDFSTPYFSIYYWCVHIKWGFVALFVIFSFIELGWIIYEKVFSKGK